MIEVENIKAKSINFIYATRDKIINAGRKVIGKLRSIDFSSLKDLPAKEYIVNTYSKIKSRFHSSDEENNSRLKQFFISFSNSRAGTFFKYVFSGKKAVVLLVALIVLLTSFTYIYLSRSHGSSEYNHRLVITLVFANLLMVLGLLGLIFTRLTRLWKQGKRQGISSSLQIRMVLIFSGLTIIPTIIMTSFSLYFITFGIQSWFDKKISNALQNSVAVAQAYLSEHSTNLKGDALAVAADIQKGAKKLQKDKESFRTFLNSQISVRSLSNAVVIKGKELLQESALTQDVSQKERTLEIMRKAGRGEVVMILQDNHAQAKAGKDLARALVKLKGFEDTFLIVSRDVDAKVVSYVRNAQDSYLQYEKLRRETQSLQLNFSFIFIGVSIVLLLIAMWFGIYYSGKIIQPINMLVDATERVKSGDLSVRMVEPLRQDELGALVTAFNRMTGNLQLNQGQLTEVGKQIEDRRRLIEAVFSGVTSGVISLDKEKKIKLYNKAAAKILNVTDEKFIGFHIKSFFPEIANIFDEVNKFPERIFQQEFEVKRESHRLNLLVRIVAEEFFGHVQGYIVSIDDVTKLVTAQRMAAWSDVARRIAHEIKNPLTPIHLSAERIRSKFESEVQDKDALNKYIDNISRHAENIGMIVKEFSDFARMPEPILKPNNLKEIIRDVIFSEKVVHPSISYVNSLPEKDVVFDFDRELVSQVLQNILKNAAESIEENQNPREKKEISIKLTHEKTIELIISDTGKGIPLEHINRLTEPYVTTRERGTGLGLAIVKKILDDHNASIDFSNNVDENGEVTGANIRIIFYS
jgi:two-component system nitrogen regulation sensor histidine kinase NtrY